jgi:hypothetical protein
VSAYKKFITFFTLAVIALIASATTTEAQGFRRHSRVVVVGGYYPYASPYWFGDPWYGYGYPWGPYPRPYGYYGFEPEGSLRIEVTPRDAEVYVDGYYAGTVDDFDGTFQRLHIETGEHEIEVYKEGFRPFRQKVYLTPDNTFRIRQALQALGPGEQPEPKPQPLSPPPSAQGGQSPMQPPQGMPRRPGGRRPLPPPGAQQGPEPRSGQPGSTSASGYGTLTIRSQPADAEVSIDGENWRGPSGQDRLTIELAEGSHTVEIRKPGYRTYVTQVEIRRGETTPLNVSLRGEQQ